MSRTQIAMEIGLIESDDLTRTRWDLDASESIDRACEKEDDDYAKDEAEREKNLDHARDNMTNDLEYNEDIGEWVQKGDK